MIEPSGILPITRLRTTILAILALAFSIGQAAAQTNRTPVVRIADLEIDPAQLPGYQAAVREEMSASIQIEPGVLAINCVAEKEAPNKLHFFEVYADPAAYEAHIASPHFRKYVDVTKSMITSRRLIETMPIQLSAKKS